MCWQKTVQIDLMSTLMKVFLSLQTPPEVLDVYPPQRHQPPLSRGGHVVSVDEDDVDFDTGGKRQTIYVCLCVCM